jgi:hypothetical protein
MAGAIEYNAYDIRKPGFESESVDGSAPVIET